jgi:hypothetical protein
MFNSRLLLFSVKRSFIQSKTILNKTSFSPPGCATRCSHATSAKCAYRGIILTFGKQMSLCKSIQVESLLQEPFQAERK